jgi:hypothetical protein
VDYDPEPGRLAERRPAWKAGLLSMTSALLGGLAVAWWHRKKLARLQNPIFQDDLQKFGYGRVRDGGTDG